jgi:hypothetical protein
VVLFPSNVALFYIEWCLNERERPSIYRGGEGECTMEYSLTYPLKLTINAFIVPM